MRAIKSLVLFGGLWAASAHAQSLDCIAVEGDSSTGLNFDVKAPPSGAAAPAGYMIVGGSCDFRPPGSESRALVTFAGVEGGYYVCRGEALDRPSPTTVYAKARAIACRVKQTDGAPPVGRKRAPFSNDGLGGNTVVLAINGGDPKKSLPVDYRLCNIAGGANIAVVDAGVAKPMFVPMGTCVETHQPLGLAFRTPDTVVVDESGFYRAFPAGVFPHTRKARLHMTDDEKLDQTLRGRVVIADAKLAAATCALPPWQGGPNVDPSWMGYCQLKELATGKNYRICFDKGFSMQAGGRLEYPGSLLPLVFSAARMADKKSDNYVGFDYQAITYGCRDVFDLKEAYILIADNTWNNQKVESIRYSFSEITIVR